MMEPSSTVKSNALGIYSTAGNPPYLWEDFIRALPQFEGLIPEQTFNLFRNLAMKTLSVEQWGQEAWEIGMAYFIAHFLIIFLRASPEVEEGSQVSISDLISSSCPGGLLKEKAANTLKMVYDNTISTSGLEGTGTFLLTTWGQNYLTLSKSMRMPMYV